MTAAPICNACLRKAGRRPRDSRCQKPACPHHHACGFCGGDTDGRFVAVAVAPAPRLPRAVA